jgi:hypothetical protein
MSWLYFFVVLLVILFFFLIFIIFSRLHLTIMYTNEKGNDHLTIKIRLWRFIHLEREVEINEEEAREKDQNEDERNLLKKLQELIEIVKNTFPYIQKFLQKCKIYQLKWDTIVGLSDASNTGIVTGLLWALKGNIIGYFSHYSQLEAHPEITITPNFHEANFFTTITCKVSVPIGQVIYVLSKLNRNNEEKMSHTLNNHLRKESVS